MRTVPKSVVLPVAVAARDAGYRGLLLPRDNSKEAAVVKGVEILPLDTLSDCVHFLNGNLWINPVEVDLDEIFRTEINYPVDFNDVNPTHQATRFATRCPTWFQLITLFRSRVLRIQNEI